MNPPGADQPGADPPGAARPAPHGWRLVAVLLALWAALAAYRQVFDAEHWRLWGAEASYLRDQRARGYQRVGVFGVPAWPAIAVARSTGDGTLAFQNVRGQRHVYRGFDGYRLKAVRFAPLSPDAPPFDLVLRRRL